MILLIYVDGIVLRIQLHTPPNLRKTTLKVSLPDEAFDPPSDLWYKKFKKFNIYDLPFLILKTRCDGRQMVDGVPTVPEQLSYTAEVQKIIIFIVF